MQRILRFRWILHWVQCAIFLEKGDMALPPVNGMSMDVLLFGFASPMKMQTFSHDALCKLCYTGMNHNII